MCRVLSINGNHIGANLDFDDDTEFGLACSMVDDGESVNAVWINNA